MCGVTMETRVASAGQADPYPSKPKTVCIPAGMTFIARGFLYLALRTDGRSVNMDIVV